MKVTHKILGVLWMAIFGYLFATLAGAIFRMPRGRADTLAINLFFVVLYLAGACASFYVVVGVSRWARIFVSMVALLTVTASVVGLFAFFNSLPFSVVGIAFSIFGVASAGLLLFPRKYAVA